jgi:hypothetical protein
MGSTFALQQRQLRKQCKATTRIRSVQQSQSAMKRSLSEVVIAASALSTAPRVYLSPLSHSRKLCKFLFLLLHSVSESYSDVSCLFCRNYDSNDKTCATSVKSEYYIATDTCILKQTLMTSGADRLFSAILKSLQGQSIEY